VSRPIDVDFPVQLGRQLAEAALTAATSAGASHADCRLERIRSQEVRLRDAAVESLTEDAEIGLGVRVLVDGTWGFASGVQLTEDNAVALARKAVELARVSRPMNSEPVELADEPSYPDAQWVSAYDVDPFGVSDAERVALLTEWSRRLLAAAGVHHVDASVGAVKEQKLYMDTAGTSTIQQRVRIHPEVTALTVDDRSGAFDSLRTIAPPVGRGWEYLRGTGWDWDTELAELPELLAEKMVAPSVEPGVYDLVIDPTNLWLTIHESIGHATELDRALGYEANFAGTSFATIDTLGSLRYGSDIMNVTGDRTVEHGLATVGYDDEGVAGQRWDLIRDGVLVGYQVDRRIAALQGWERSNGCGFADSPGHVSIQRMANVSLQPAPNGPGLTELLAGVDDGLYVVGDRSWSIDMQRYNFQFTGQRFYRIRHGKLAGQVRDAAYQATTTDFWGSMDAIGGPQTYVLAGAFNCGKGQPDQVAPVSHGAPVARFRGVRILNAIAEGGR
jgi:TldD protein